MKIQREMISHKLLDEVSGLLEKNKAEVNHLGTSLKINRDMYVYCDTIDTYRGYVVRDNNDTIVGYVGFWVSPDSHSIDHVLANQDLLYVRESKRGGLIGLKLLKFAEKDLKSIGVNFILQQSPTDQPITPLMKRLGYEETAVVYKKEI